MRYHWLNRQNNNKLIIFFGGWSFDFYPFEFLKPENYDVLMFYDYENLEIPFVIPEYTENILISWSMGVYAAYVLKDMLPKFDKKIAINGTPYPIDNRYGIPEKTFNLTLKYAEEGLKSKFYQNVFSNPEHFERYLKTPVRRTVKDRAEELAILSDLIKRTEVCYEDGYYDTAIVSSFDKIIPPKNQLNMWGEKSVVINGGHFPFYSYESWGEICSLI